MLQRKARVLASARSFSDGKPYPTVGRSSASTGAQIGPEGVGPSQKKKTYVFGTSDS